MDARRSLKASLYHDSTHWSTLEIVRRSAKLLVIGGLLLAVSLGVGISLMTRARGAICFSAVNQNTYRYPCDPGLSLPYFWPGFTLLVAGGFVALVLLAFGVRRWVQTPTTEWR